MQGFYCIIITVHVSSRDSLLHKESRKLLSNYAGKISEPHFWSLYWRVCAFHLLYILRKVCITFLQ